MKLNKVWLHKHSASPEGAGWMLAQKTSDPEKLLKAAIRDHRLGWANWGIVRLMNHKQQVQYAIYAAEQVIDIYEKKYPKDDKPRKTIEAAKAFVKVPNEENKNIAYAAYAADAAAAAAAAAAYADADAAAAAMKIKILKYGLKLITKNGGTK